MIRVVFEDHYLKPLGEDFMPQVPEIGATIDLGGKVYRVQHVHWLHWSGQNGKWMAEVTLALIQEEGKA